MAEVAWVFFSFDDQEARRLQNQRYYKTILALMEETRMRFFSKFPPECLHFLNLQAFDYFPGRLNETTKAKLLLSERTFL